MLHSHILEDTDQALVTAGHHLIGSVRGLESGPTVILLGGIHGNEPAGVLACMRVFPLLEEKQSVIRGEVVFLAGNTRALLKGSRYVDEDLNRQWAADPVCRVSAFRVRTSESLERQELLTQLEKVLTSARGEVYSLASPGWFCCPFTSPSVMTASFSAGRCSRSGSSSRQFSGG